MARDYYEDAGWNAICDRCGFKFKATDLKQTWDGLMVCQDDWEPRHPQDFVRGVTDDQHVPWNRDEGPDTFIPVTFFYYYCYTNVAIPGQAVAGCMVPGNIVNSIFPY